MFFTLRQQILFLPIVLVGLVCAPAFADLAVGGGAASVSIKNTSSNPIPVYAPSPLPISNLSNIQVGNGQYFASPVPVSNGQAGSVLTDNLLRQIVVFPTSQPVTIEQNNLIVDRSGTIISGTYEQVLMPANPKRHGFSIQNQSTHPMYINFITGYATGAAGDYLVAAGTTYVTPLNMAPKGVVGIYDTTANDIFSAVEY